jgi:predicted nucleic acid-binding protein
MSAVLVDTGPLYSLAVPSDEHHITAQHDSRRLREQNLDIVVVYPVLLETYRLLLRRVALVSAHGWLTQVTASSSFVNPREKDYLEAAQRVRRYRDQPLTLVDAILAVFSERSETPVWTYDHHFDVMRIERWR